MDGRPRRERQEEPKRAMPKGQPYDDREASAAASTLFAACREFAASIAVVVRQLLETKHLYQRGRVLSEAAEKKIEAVTNAGLRQQVLGEFRRAIAEPWSPLGRNSEWQPEGDLPLSGVMFQMPDARLYCPECASVQAFNALADRRGLYDVPGRVYEGDGKTDRGTIQAFAIAYLCQACKKAPEVFLVRREGPQLILCGRSPIEQFSVPGCIPKEMGPFFSGAVIAHQSGQTLAGNFLLRTLVEQFARFASGATPEMRADQVIEAYMATLPDDFKRNFPSFKDIYSKLSADIHAAVGDAGVFDEAQASIVRHFEARRIMPLRKTAAEPAS